jgi:hypothetical protein
MKNSWLSGVRSPGKAGGYWPRFGAPAFHQLMLDTELIADTRDDEIDQIVDCLGSVIKSWTRGQHDGPC